MQLLLFEESKEKKLEREVQKLREQSEKFEKVFLQNTVIYINYISIKNMKWIHLKKQCVDTQRNHKWIYF